MLATSVFSGFLKIKKKKYKEGMEWEGGKHVLLDQNAWKHTHV